MLVYCVSPNHLESIMDEFKKLNTILQGYGNFKMASEKIITVNKQELLGVIIVADAINYKGKWFNRFLYKLNLMGKTRVVIAVNSQDNLNEISTITKQYNNLDFYGVSDYILTDKFIRHDLLGTLLSDVPAYIRIGKTDKDRSAVLNTNGSYYAPLVSSDIINCSMDVKIRSSVENAIIEDDYLNLISNDLIKELRILKIKTYYGKSSIDEMIEMKSNLETLTGKTKCFALSIFYWIEEEYYAI